MITSKSKAFFIAWLVGLELLREWYVLKRLGFDVGRFAEWMRGPAYDRDR